MYVQSFPFKEPWAHTVFPSCVDVSEATFVKFSLSSPSPPLTLGTPPSPWKVNKELGERRQAGRGPASIAFGEEVVAPDGGKMVMEEFVKVMEERVRAEYAKLDAFHASQY